MTNLQHTPIPSKTKSANANAGQGSGLYPPLPPEPPSRTSATGASASQPENMKQHLYAFGQSLGKSKRGSRIPVQTTAVSRRKFPHGGRSVGVSGRRVQDSSKRMRMDVTETEETIIHTLPSQKPQAPISSPIIWLLLR